MNAILNALIREGVITAFETNFGDPVSLALALHVRAAADVVTDHGNPAYDERRVRAIRERITKDIEPLAPSVIVSVRTTPGKSLPPPPAVRALSGQQCREARRAIGWSIETLCHEAGIGKDAVNRFEREKGSVRPETLAAIVGALERGGAEFTDGGARLNPGALKRKRS